MSKPFSVLDDTREIADTDILMQYTGLKDKNGVEIYEGDVISTLRNNGKGYLVTDKKTLRAVEWSNTEKYYGGPSKIGFNLTPGKVYVVHGNIYENPELLEK